jgi:hypothetical protein
MDDFKCLSCTCTFETGCREERLTNATLKALLEQRRRPIPPKYCPAPPGQAVMRDPAQQSRHNSNLRRIRIERLGGTVREKSVPPAVAGGETD